MPATRIICRRSLNEETGNFDILIQIVLDDYVAKEQLLDFIEIIPKLIELDDSNNVIDQDSYPIKRIYFNYSVRHSLIITLSLPIYFITIE